VGDAVRVSDEKGLELAASGEAAEVLLWELSG
jgi:hypothetical protein